VLLADSSAQGFDELTQRGEAAHADIAAVKAAGYPDRLAGIGERIGSVDKDRGRAPHSKAQSVLRRVNLVLPNGRHLLRPGEGELHEVPGRLSVRAAGHVDQVDLHGATVRLPAYWKVKGRLMRIGEVAARSGISTNTIRYYEDIGVLPRPERSASGYRDYAVSVLDRLAFVRAAQAIGLSLGEIRSIVALRDEGETPCGHVLHLLRHRAADLDRRIAELLALRDELHRLVARAEALDPTDCDQRRICHLIGPA
jgi:MerR family transcriptional regulator, copper efflux regulator